MVLVTLRCGADRPVGDSSSPAADRARCSARAQDRYLALSDPLVDVKRRIRQLCPIPPLPGRPPLVYMDPRLRSVLRDWFVIGGGKAPDGGLGQSGPIRSRLWSPGGRLHGRATPPYLLA